MDLLKELVILLAFLIYFSYGHPLDLSRSNIAMEPSKTAGQALTDWSKGDRKGNAEEQGPYFEGDIILSEARNGVPLAGLRWPKGIIPYEIEGKFTNEQKNMISNAIDELKSKTCIKFIPRGGEKDYISIRSDDSGCWSSVGRTGGKQIVNLQAPCLKVIGTSIHELIHAIGFYHEQNRSIRDKYVRIVTENIPKDKYVNFEKLEPSDEEDFGLPYDYKSVMHYSPYSFSVNGKATIESKGSPESAKIMGQRTGLSFEDIRKINKMYNCDK